MANKTTKKHFELFKTECRKWIERFGLKDWEIHFSHEIWNSISTANMRASVLGRVATLNLCPDWQDSELNNEQIKASAFHEVCELLLCRMAFLAQERCTALCEIEEETHTIIRRLENAFFREG